MESYKNSFKKNNKKTLDKKKYDIPKLNTYLNQNEIDNLKNLEKMSQKANKFISEKNDILNLSIREFLSNWADNNIAIFSDTVKFFSDIKNYSSYFRDIDETSNWTSGIYIILVDFIDIFKKDKRSIYFGLTLILISLLLFFIQITS